MIIITEVLETGRNLDCEQAFFLERRCVFSYPQDPRYWPSSMLTELCRRAPVWLLLNLFFKLESGGILNETRNNGMLI